MGKKKEKRIPTVQMEESISYSSLEDVIDTAKSLMEKYPETLKSFADFEMDTYTPPYSSGAVYASMTYNRPETALETAAREAREADFAETAKRHRRIQYEALKKEFETG